jgi:predicted dehydrogenase
MKSHPVTRRDVLKGIALGGATLALGRNLTWAEPSSRQLNVGIVGVSHRGGANVDEIAKLDIAKIVALCDVDQSALDKQAARFPDAKTYRDFRKMMGQPGLDAVLVSTPDHTHAIVTMAALESGKHVYCEKPLTHTMAEARLVRETAQVMKRVTQMGTQIHAGENYRRVVELIRGGAIGAVSEVHVMCGKNWGAVPLPATTATVPSDIDYDLWQGPVAKPYRPEYMHGGWRRWYTFGNGTLGDMGCHYMDLAFWSLNLTAPTTIRAEGDASEGDGCPQALVVHYDFPSNGARSALKLHWYDGGKLPAQYDDWKIPDNKKNGLVFVGEKGHLFADYDSHALLPIDQFKNFKPPAPTIAKSIGHHREWVKACLDNNPSATTCNFDYAGPLTETVLLGAIAYRAGTELNWDAEKQQITNNPKANELLRISYRDGWKL